MYGKLGDLVPSALEMLMEKEATDAQTPAPFPEAPTPPSARRVRAETLA